MSLDWLALTALGGGLLATCWRYVKTMAWRLVSLVIVRAKLENEVGHALALYCWQRLRRSPFGEKRYATFRGFVRPAQRWQTIGYERVGSDATVFWRGWFPVTLSLFEGSSNVPNAPNGVHVTFLRGTFHLERLLIEAIDLYNGIKQESDGHPDRFCVEREFGDGPMRHRTRNDSLYSGKAPEEQRESLQPEWRLLQWRRDQVGEEKSSDPWGVLAFPPEIQDLVTELRHWKASEAWYRSRRIPWRRGVLLYGKPGTGKTSFARAVAQELDLPVVAFDLTSFGNPDFVRAWRRLVSRAPCMALLEDIDAVFDGRENRLGEEGGGLSFDCLLNCLSGIESADGVLVIVTTNRLECLDDALGVPDADGVSTRPGRIDRTVELPVLNADCRRRVAERILADCHVEIESIVMDGEGESGAQFVERCSRVALACYWDQAQRNGHKRVCVHDQ